MKSSSSPDFALLAAGRYSAIRPPFYLPCLFLNCNTRLHQFSLQQSNSMKHLRLVTFVKFADELNIWARSIYVIQYFLMLMPKGSLIYTVPNRIEPEKAILSLVIRNLEGVVRHLDILQ